jgi:methyltransferase (TIGR00027 family)
MAGRWSEALIDAGLRRTQPTCWLLEGFLFYLPAQTGLEILDLINTLSAPGSRTGFDVPNRITFTHAWTRAWVEMQAAHGAPFLAAMDDPAAVMAERGWSAAVVQAGDKEANYGRWPYPAIPHDVPDLPRHWLVTAEKQ